MRTKTLILTAALTAAGMTAASAQVFSVNAVGYVKKTVPAGEFALLSNPLNSTGENGNNLDAVLPDMPAGVQVFEFNPDTGAYSQYVREDFLGELIWTGTGAEEAELDTDEGFWFLNGTGEALELVFVGEVPQGDLSTQVSEGFSLLGSHVPQEGQITSQLGLQPEADDNIFIFRDNAFLQGNFSSLFDSWTGNAIPDGADEPVVQVAEGFFYQTGNARSWDRSFNVNDQ